MVSGSAAAQTSFQSRIAMSACHVPRASTERDGFAVRNLRTPYGLLSYSLKIDGQQRVLEVAELQMPTGGVAIAWPEGAQPKNQSLQRGSGHWIGTELRVTDLPLTITLPADVGDRLG